MGERDEDGIDALWRENRELRDGLGRLRKQNQQLTQWARELYQRANALPCRCRCACNCHSGVCILHAAACCEPCPFETERGT